MILHYKFYQSGKPVLVMVHGLLSSLETFEPLVPELQKHFDLLLVDQRGHGKSHPEGTDYSADQMARDLKRLFDSLHLQKVTLLGHSMGGRTVLRFGELFPEMVEKLIVEDMGIHQRQPRSPEKDQEKLEMARKAHVNSLFFKSKDDIFTIISPLYSYAKDLLKTKVVEHGPEKYELKFWPDVSVLYGYQGNTTDLTSALTTTTFPVLFIVADPEVGSAMTEKCIEHIKESVPRARFHFIPKSWHNIHKTHPREFCEAVIEFAKN